MNNEFGFGGMLVLDVGSMKNAYQFMEEMQNNNIGYLAVSLGFYKLYLLLALAHHRNTAENSEMVLWKDGRMSIGLDNDIERTFRR